MTTSLGFDCDAVAPTQKPIIGTFKTKDGHWTVAKIGERHQTEINLDDSIALPSTVLAFQTMDVGSSDGEIHVQTSIDNIYPRGFTFHLSSHSRTILYSSCLNYLVIDGTKHLLQTGTADSHSLRMSKQGGDVVTRVKFRYPYNAPPRVLATLAGLGIGGENSTSWEIRTFATDVDSQGFTIHIEKQKDREEVAAGRAIGNAQVSWFAYPEGGVPGLSMCSGEVRFGEGELGCRVDGKAQYGGAVPFPRRFKTPPQVFLGLTNFDLGKPQNLRIGVGSVTVTEETMEWKAWTWGGTRLNSAAFAYLVIEAT